MCYTVNEIIIMKGGTPMKHTKKLRAKNLLALLLAAIIGLGLSIPAMAEEPAFDEAPAIEVIEKLPAPEEPALIGEQGIPQTPQGIWALIKAFFINPSATGIDAIVQLIGIDSFLPAWAISLIVNLIILPLFPPLATLISWMGRIMVILGLFDIGPIQFE